MPETIRYFKLAEFVGREPAVIPDPKNPGEFKAHPRAGEPGPLVQFKVTVATPVMADGELLDVAREIDLPDPRFAVIEDEAERVFKVIDPTVALAFDAHDLWREVEPPKTNSRRDSKSPADKE